MQTHGVPPHEAPPREAPPRQALSDARTTDGADLRRWEKVTTAYRTANGLSEEIVAGSNARTEAARSVASARVGSHEGLGFPVDLYIDPVCPYTWLAACWLRLVEQHRRIDLQYHPMSLELLNEHKVGNEKSRAYVAQTTGPSRVATAVWLHHGPQAFRTWHTAFGALIFDHWRHPDAEEYRTASIRALRETGLPEELIEAADSDDYVEPLRRSHLEATLPVGVDAGTPVIHLGGMAYFGPVLNAIPTIDDALDLFDGVVLLASCHDFFELKRSRTSPPVFTRSGSGSGDPAYKGVEP